MGEGRAPKEPRRKKKGGLVCERVCMIEREKEVDDFFLHLCVCAHFF